MRFGEFPNAFGHVQFKTWREWDGEYLKRSYELTGDMQDAILRAEWDGFRGRVRADIHNLVENAGFDLLLAFLNNEAPSGISYVALGTSNTAPTGIETQLPDEQIRLPVSSTTRTPGQLVVVGFFDTPQANTTLGSAALFGGTASSATNSGSIYSYVVYSQFTKNGLESLTAQWTLGFQAP